MQSLGFSDTQLHHFSLVPGSHKQRHFRRPQPATRVCCITWDTEITQESPGGEATSPEPRDWTLTSARLSQAWLWFTRRLAYTHAGRFYPAWTDWRCHGENKSEALCFLGRRLTLHVSISSSLKHNSFLSTGSPRCIIRRRRSISQSVAIPDFNRYVNLRLER